MDDNLVMEIDQADMVTEEVETTLEEVKKPEIPAEAGQVKSLRRLGSRSGLVEESTEGFLLSRGANDDI